MARDRAGRGRRVPKPAFPAAPDFALASSAGAAAPSWADPAAWVVVALFAALLAWVAFRIHVVGDYSTESDFYGGYAEGARLLQRGRVDFARWAVVGPGYEAALALVGAVTRDLFVAARAISVVSAIATLLFWRSIVRARLGTGVALVAVAVLATNAVLFRYSWSASTDLLAVALQAATLWLVLVPRGRAAPFTSGVLAAVATLTRYNSVFLVPAAVAAFAGLAPAHDAGRRRAVLLHLAGFALVFAPWCGLSLAAGHLPGASLFANFGSFYQVEDASRNVQDLSPAMAESLDAVRSAGRVPGGGVIAMLARFPQHLRDDAAKLLGWPVTLLVLLGAVLAWFDGTWRRLLPIALAGALAFATLAPVFYSDRYSLAVLPAYATLAGAAVCSPRVGVRLRGFPLAWLVALALLALTVRAAVPEQRRLLGNQPVETIAMGRTLAQASRPGDRVMSRKAQIGFYSNRTVVPFPRVATLPELAAAARASGARFLWYSWYEALVRAEFAYLLDTTAVVPGLRAVAATRHNPAVLYEIGPGFGTSPAWAADRALASLHAARAQVQYLPAEQAATAHVVLAADALDRADPESALDHLSKASAAGPLGEPGWRLTGHALRLLGRFEPAASAYERALAMDAGDSEARLGLGWVWRGTGDLRKAAATWRPAIGPRCDDETLAEMVRVFAEVGDTAGERAARAELANRSASR